MDREWLSSSAGLSADYARWMTITSSTLMLVLVILVIVLVIRRL